MKWHEILLLIISLGTPVATGLVLVFKLGGYSKTLESALKRLAALEADCAHQKSKHDSLSGEVALFEERLKNMSGTVERVAKRLEEHADNPTKHPDAKMLERQHEETRQSLRDMREDMKGIHTQLGELTRLMMLSMKERAL